MVASAFFLSLLGLVRAPPPSPHPQHSIYDHNTLQVQTESGLARGKVDVANPNVRQFLGIPYAQPPTGKNRWLPAQKLHQPNAQIDATQLPSSCIQYLTNQPSVYTQETLEYNLQDLNKTGTISEDCLTLSVWTPHDGTSRNSSWPSWKTRPDRSELRPVFIFLYGGAFVTGGQDVPYQIPAQWVQRTQDHLVVSLNYRLNIFGFPNAAGADDQNLGILDQRLAVEWLQENIAAFGGDPDRMILWGQSAGALAVDYYNFAWPQDPIVKGLIMDSGNAQAANLGADPVVQSGTPGASFSLVAHNVGCANLTDNPTAELDCMRGVDALTINDFISSYQQSGASPSITFRVFADDKIIFSNYTDRALSGLEANIPAIIGTNALEGQAFAPYSPTGPDPAIAEFITLQFFCPTTQTARLRQETGKLTYRYYYNGNFTNISPAPWMGAYHAAELPMIMGTHPNFRGASSDLEYATSEAMQDAYLAFARDPYNGPQSVGWRPYTALGADQVREFGAGVPAQDISLASEEAKCTANLPAV